MVSIVVNCDKETQLFTTNKANTSCESAGSGVVVKSRISMVNDGWRSLPLLCAGRKGIGAMLTLGCTALSRPRSRKLGEASTSH